MNRGGALALTEFGRQGHGQESGGDEGDRHKNIGGAEIAGRATEVADEISTDECAEGAKTVDEGDGAACDVGGKDVGDEGEEGTVWGVHRKAGEAKEGEGQPKIIGAIEPGAAKGDSAEEEEGPDGEFTVAGTVGEPGGGHHGKDSEEVGDGGEPADPDNVDFGGEEEDGREPKDKAIHAETP